LHSTSATESAAIIAMSHDAWPEENTRALLLSEFDERFRRYRLSVPEAERALVDSLKRYGQMASVLVNVCGGGFVLIDGIATLPTQSAGKLPLVKFNKRKFLSVIDVDTG